MATPIEIRPMLNAVLDVSEHVRFTLDGGEPAHNADFICYMIFAQYKKTTPGLYSSGQLLFCLRRELERQNGELLQFTIITTNINNIITTSINSNRATTTIIMGNKMANDTVNNGDNE